MPFTSRSEVAKESEKFQRILESAPKDRMHHNLRNMSVQLNALDDLYEHLEKELQSSAMVLLPFYGLLIEKKNGRAQETACLNA